MTLRRAKSSPLAPLRGEGTGVRGSFRRPWFYPLTPTLSPEAGARELVWCGYTALGYLPLDRADRSDSETIPCHIYSIALLSADISSLARS